jgi:hypothetical protein
MIPFSCKAVDLPPPSPPDRPPPAPRLTQLAAGVLSPFQGSPVRSVGFSSSPSVATPPTPSSRRLSFCCPLFSSHLPERQQIPKFPRVSAPPPPNPTNPGEFLEGLLLDSVSPSPVPSSWPRF